MVAGTAFGAAPAAVRGLERQGRGLRFFPRILGAHAHPKWFVSRVLFRRPVTRESVRIIHLDDALLRRSSTLTRMLAASSCDATALGGPPSTASLFELAPGGACPAAGHPAVARGLLPHGFALACASARTPFEVRASPAIGGLVSVALSLGSPRVAVSDLPALWSPDFPPADDGCPPAILHPPPAAPRLPGCGRAGQANRRSRTPTRDRGVIRCSRCERFSSKRRGPIPY
jgi:hypothetical protein